MMFNIFNTLFAQDDAKILTPVQFQEAISKTGVQLIDVRTPEEYAEGHIGNAVMANIRDARQFDAEVAKLNKEKPVYLYCRSGNRSQTAAKILEKDGFKVFDLQGGILNWQKSKLPVNP